MSEPTPSPQPPVVASPPSRYSMGSAANMARSLAVLLALVAGLVLLVPRVSSVEQREVDARSVVSYAVKESGTAFSYPEGLGAGWKATSARYAIAEGSPTWQAGWTTPSGQYAGIRETKAPSAAWLDVARVKGPSTAVVIGERTWEQRRDDRGQLSLTSASPTTGVTTVLTGTGGLEELKGFAERLAAAKPAA